jgi:hypothetical protein
MSEDERNITSRECFPEVVKKEYEYTTKLSKYSVQISSERLLLSGDDSQKIIHYVHLI